MADKSPEQRKDESRSMDTASRLQEIREAAHEDFDALSELHKHALVSLEFLRGRQWSHEAAQDRKADRRPMLTFSKLTQFLDGVIGGQMQRRTSVKVRAEDRIARSVYASLESKKRVAMAEALEGLYRQIEANSRGQMAYINAFEGGVGWGFGHFRFLVDYVTGSFDRDIMVLPIMDPFSVAWDQSSMMIDRSDARRCIITSLVPKDQFKEQYPGAVASDWTSNSVTVSHGSEWIRDNNVVLAERFTKEQKDVLLCELSDGRIVEWEDKEEQIRDELAKRGVAITRQRKAKMDVIKWCLVSGGDVLEDEITIEGKHIPVVTCYGRPIWDEGKMHYRSLIENALDEQRAYNYARTAIIEAISSIPKAPWIIGSSQIQGYENTWKTANVRMHAYLPWNDAGDNKTPPQRNYATQDLSALAALAQMCEQGMMSGIGRYQASMGAESNEKSGRAVLARAQQADTVTQPFVDNFEIALTQGGRIVMSMIPEVYSADCVARILNEDGTDDAFTIGAETIIDEQTGDEIILNDLAAGRYSIKVDTGPSFETRRQESMQGMVEFGQAFPQIAAILGPEALANSDFPGAERAAKMARAMLPPNVVAAGEDQEQEIPPHVQAAMQQAEQAMQQAQALVQQNEQEMKAHEQKIAELELRNQVDRAKMEDQARDEKFEYDRRLFEMEKRLFELKKTRDAIQTPQTAA